MNKRLTILAALLLVAATTAVAQERRRSPERTTVIVRDGKLLDIDGEPFMLGGKRAYLGVGTTDLTPQLREYFGASKDAGVLVGSVESGSPADKAGVKVGDVIVSVDGKDIESLSDLRHALREKKDGDTARVEVLRNGKRQTVVATLAEKEVELPRYFRGLDPEEFEKFRLRVAEPGQWKTRIEALPNCAELQTRIHELETRLKDLEKKLQK